MILECISKFINDVPINRDTLRDFFNAGIEKMKSYFASNCDLIIRDIKKYQSIGEPEKGLAICLLMPNIIPCYSTIENLESSLYTSISYKMDYAKFISAKEFVSKGEYENAFNTLKDISIYSKFYEDSKYLTTKINDFIFLQKEYDRKNELKVKEITLQAKKNELQEGINKTNIYINQQKLEADKAIAQSEQANQRTLKQMELNSNERKEEIKKETRSLELQSEERKNTMNIAGSLLNSYISKPQPVSNFYLLY